MQSGKLDQQVTLQEPTETNVDGDLTLTYGAAISVWAHVISQRGNEAFEAARTNARNTIRVAIRYRSDVTSKWRVNWNSQAYNITNLDASEKRNGMLWLTAELSGA